MFFRQHRVDRTTLLIRFANQTTSRAVAAELKRMGADRRYACPADQLSRPPSQLAIRQRKSSGHPRAISVNLNEWFTLQRVEARTTVLGPSKGFPCGLFRRHMRPQCR